MYVNPIALNMIYKKWKEILSLWEPLKILDGYSKLPGIHMVKLAHGLKAHEILLYDWLAMGGNLHLLTMTKFCYNNKKGKVI
jgi:hypothetical protein